MIRSQAIAERRNMDDDAKCDAWILGGSLETALFDTGSLINVVDPPIADKIGIEKYPPATGLGFGNWFLFLFRVSSHLLHLHMYTTDLL